MLPGKLSIEGVPILYRISGCWRFRMVVPLPDLRPSNLQACTVAALGVDHGLVLNLRISDVRVQEI